MFNSFKNNETVFALYSGVWQTATLIALEGKLAEIKLHENRAVKENVTLELGIIVVIYVFDYL
jgi:hypothetical protein